MENTHHSPVSFFRLCLEVQDCLDGGSTKQITCILNVRGRRLLKSKVSNVHVHVGLQELKIQDKGTILDDLQ